MLNPCRDGRWQRSDLPMELVSPITGHAVAATTAAVQADDTLAESMARHDTIELIEVA